MIQDCQIGHRTIIHPYVNLYGCDIGADCMIAFGCEVGRGVKIGHHVRVQFGSFIPPGVTIEDNVFIGPGVKFCNDKHPPATREDFVPQQILVKRGASIGAGAIILPGLIIGEGAIVGAGALVNRDVRPGETVVGVPCKTLGQPSHCKCNLRCSEVRADGHCS